jgi:hypothetical protein
MRSKGLLRLPIKGKKIRPNTGEECDQAEGFSFTERINYLFSKAGASKNFRTCCNPYLVLDLSIHVNKTSIHLVTQSLLTFHHGTSYLL